MALRRDAVRVRVPATSANLGPGFDTVGLALDLHDELVAMVTDDEGVLVEVSGEGCTVVPLDESHLVVRAMSRAFAALGERPAGFVLRCTNRIPHGRGLGSSAAAIVGGIVLARTLVVDGAERLTDADVLQVALTMESHPDNLAAALLGGFTVAWLDDGRAEAVRMATHADVRPLVLVPQSEVATDAARAMLPELVHRDDAVANLARTALLVHAITVDPSLLLAATADRMHQDARASAYPDSMALVTALRSAGVPAAISGAGPSVLAFCVSPDHERAALEAAEGWQAQGLAVADRGAHEVPATPSP